MSPRAPGDLSLPGVDVDALASLAEPIAAAAVTLARRFAAGATMWCVAPRWPAHGRHVAVEFVHPVIMGKRALPAVHLDDEDVVGSLRLLGHAGDILLAVGTADDARLAALLPRSQAWGLASVWIGGGPHPAPGVADHVLWIDGASPEELGASAGFVLLYHLLWELTHVVFEHPGLVEPAPDCTEEVCVTCSDEGRLAEVVRMVDDDSALVLADGHRETVATQLVDTVGPGDLLLVHAGTAIAVVQRGSA